MKLSLKVISVATIAALCKGAFATESIKNKRDFIYFSNVVGQGYTYEGETVYLENDIDLENEIFSLIGPFGNNGGFVGTFDGLGHTIKGLVIEESNQIAALFGSSGSYSNESLGGATIRNLVIAKEASIMTSYDDGEKSEAILGSIMGLCYARNHPCVIENCVNMASLAYSKSGSVIIGGIVSIMWSYGSNVVMRNCANYGDISSTSSSAIIGGISGLSSGVNSPLSIINCLNFGNINANVENPTTLYIGGISGTGNSLTTVTMCVNMGTITAGNRNTVRSIVGGNNGASMTNNFYSDNVGFLDTNGCYIFFEENLTSGQVSVPHYLNFFTQRYASMVLSQWATNLDNNDVTFKVSGNDYIGLKSKLILLPNLMDNGVNLFNGWYRESELETPFDGVITGDTVLYATYNKEESRVVNITFKLEQDKAFVIQKNYGELVELPMNFTNEHYIFMGWLYADGVHADTLFKVPGHNVTLYGDWLLNHIETADDFKTFANNLASGSTYKGITVFLDSDIDMKSAGAIIPMSQYFSGTFNGMGHTISGLIVMNQNTLYIGMFGLLLGSTVTNLVLDESCMVYNTVNDNNLIMRIGGIAGVISGSNDAVRVKNCVVMSTIIQFGNSSQTYIGGIAGFATNDDYGAEIKNCAYIGTSGTIETHNIIVFGGIVGFGTGVVIKNSIFNGQFLDESDYGTFLYIGGIIGYKNGEIEVDNCVAIENYMTSNGCSYNRIIGNGNDMVGNNFWSGYIRFSGNNDGYEFYKNLTTEELSLDYYKGNSLIEALNAYCTEYPHLELSQWIGNKELFNLTFNINGEETITIDSPVVLTQSLADVPPYLFDGWYEDINKEVLFKEGEITSDTTLYATYKTDDTHASTITFYSDEEEVFSAIVRYGNTVEFPTNVTKKGYILIGWLYKDGSQVSIPFVMPSYNISLYARWAICQIFSADDFKVFTENVNAHGYSYEGLTVSLEEDIVFSTNETQTSVSTEGTFLGTFDGKGHVISNFIIEEKVYNIVGLFRILYEGTIKDVIMDGTCSVSSAFTTTEYNVFVGSILGVGISSIGMVSVTNCVNMGSVGYKGECQYNSTIIGGIAGSIQLDQYNFMVSKCTNYGSVLMSGTSNKLFMGGIVGSALGEQDIPYVVSCLNNGLVRDVSYDGDKRIGGIIGYSYFVSVIGCVSFGEVITDNAGAEDFVHPVIGDGIQNYISNNFYYEGMGCTDQTKSTSFDDNYFESGGSDIVGILNGLGTEYGKWSIATFVCNGGELYVHAEWRRRRRRGDGGGDEDGKYAVIRGHIPPIMKSERRFAGWFQDEHFEGEPVNGTNLADRVTLYAGYGHRLIYDPNGGTIGKNNYTRTLVECNDIIKYYPSVAINCKALSRWEPKNDTLIVKTGEGSDTTLSYSSSSSFSSSEKYYVMPDRNVTLMAVWTQVMYTITFNNSELEPTQIPCSGTFNPEDYVPPGRQGYIFDGWYIDQMFTMKVPRLPCVSSDYIIYAKWEFNGTALSSSSQSASGYNASKNSSSSSSSSNNNGRYDANKDEGTNVGVIVGPIVGVLVVIIIVIVIVFILIVKRRHNDNDDDDDDDNEGYVDERRNLELDERRKGKGEEDADRGSRGDRERDYDMYTRVVSKAGAEEGENNNNNISSSSNGKLIKSLNSQYNLYPEYYHIPSIEEALMEAGLGEKRAKKVAATCYEKAEKVMQNLPGELTKDDAAALAMYTFDFGAKHYESNPFRLINKGLVGGTTESLTRIRGLLYLVTTALRKLPRVTGRTLYRGVRKDANIDQKCYNDGVIVTWNAFSSTSPDMNATKAFLAKGSEDGKAAGTLFIIEKGWGYDIQPYSLFPDEAEILLEPERQFKVTSVLSSELVVITLEMIETPLVLPQIFGGPDN